MPPWGFVIEGPGFAAFHARRWAGQEYGKGALFTLQAIDKKNLKDAHRVRVFHAFGPATIRWKGGLYKVQREQVIRPVRTGKEIRFRFWLSEDKAGKEAKRRPTGW